MRVILVFAFAACNRGEPTAAPPPSTPPRIAVATDAPPVDAAMPCPIWDDSLGPGLTIERWHVPDAKIVAGEPCIDVVRADMSMYKLRAFASKDAKSALHWQRDHELVAVINAGMFHEGGAPVGLVVVDGKEHGIDNKKFGGYLAWSPSSPRFPEVAMASRSCAKSGIKPDVLRASYESLVQSYRLLDCDGSAIAWQDPKRYSAAAIGVDKHDRIVFVHARGAFTMLELSTALSQHDLAGALFLEGGPEASLVVRGAAGTLERVGSYETGFNENDDNKAFWDLPNVIGLVRR